MKSKNTVLWRLELHESDIVSYLMGTMHARSEEAYTHIDFATEHLNNCNVFAGEIDLSQSNNQNNEFFLPEGITLLSLLGPKKYSKYAKIIKKAFDFQLDDIHNFKPLVAQNIILEKIIEKAKVLPLDFRLHEIASHAGKTLTGIETMEEQNNILKSIPIELQLKMFKDAFTHVKRMKRMLDKTVSLYAAGDVNGLYKESKKGLGKLRKIMLYERNSIMTDRILELVKADSSFIAIGAAHLGGNKGVLKLLMQKGIKVTPA